MRAVNCLLSLLILGPAIQAGEFRMVARPPPKVVAEPVWKSGIDFTVEGKKRVLLYFTADW